MHARVAVNGGFVFAYVPLLGGPSSCQRITESTMCVGVCVQRGSSVLTAELSFGIDAAGLHAMLCMSSTVVTSIYVLRVCKMQNL